MKTLILYATKYGAAREIAQKIAGIIDGSEIRDLKEGGIPPLSEYDCVIVGSSIYVGKIRKEARTFIAENSDALCGKRLGLYISGFEPQSAEACFKSNFPEKLLSHATVTAFLGGILDPKKAGGFDLFLLRAAKVSAGYMNTISDVEIKRFAEALSVDDHFADQ